MHAPSRAIALALAIAWLDAGRVAASITPEAQRVVDAYVEATGGRDAFEAERTLHVRGTIQAIGLKGSFESWSAAPNRIVTSVVLGSMRFQRGFDGKTAWQTELGSKKVTVLDGHDREEAVADAWFQHEMWARPDQGGGSVTTASRAFGDRGSQVALEIRPPVGESRRFWFDQKSGRVTRVVSRRDQHEWSEGLADYRTLGGRVRALTTECGDAATGAGYQRLHVDSVWVNVEADSGLFTAPAATLGSRRWLQRSNLATIPFRYGTQHVWVRASINGAPPADFLLDTGASTTALDSAYAARLGLLPEGATLVQGMGGAGSAAYAQVRTLRMAGPDGDGIEVGGLRVALLDVSRDLEPVLWRRAAGLIGYDVISRFVLEIDYDQKKLTLRDPASFHYEGKGAALPLTLTDNVPTVRVQLDDGCAGDFLVDLGNGFNVNVHGSLVRRCRLFGRKRKEVELWGGGFAGSFATTLCRLGSIAVGPYRWEEPIAALSLTTSGIAGSREIAGNLGNGALERFKCTFDYERRTLWLEPGKRYGQRDRFPRSGTTLVRLGDRVVAGGVTRGSAADAAGIQPLDEVTAIDGRPILRYSPEELDRLFLDGPVGSTHSITVRRRGVRRTHTLKLADVL